ncbi:hypothetical protein P4N68_00905 [Corynebacterium felinum]|uniref:Uncharacterized protein n=1 Tax=Corynebacterium felinum TaxID=131318 RepID=A0ABU2B9U6_9CORY|nr:hypothetical protein [Corynebacterium felinum]MDF5819639.1 hypothetical protein [Corynebacterium felinum]MDR7355046.1 hypothetical protein [Corynebacterium felinum]
MKKSNVPTSLLSALFIYREGEGVRLLDLFVRGPMNPRCQK